VNIEGDPWAVTILDNSKPVDEDNNPSGECAWPKMRCKCNGTSQGNSICIHKLTAGIFLGERCGFTLPKLVATAHDLGNQFKRRKRVKVNEGRKAPVMEAPEPPYGVRIHASC
jgi:hypothetical protein